MRFKPILPIATLAAAAITIYVVWPRPVESPIDPAEEKARNDSAASQSDGAEGTKPPVPPRPSASQTGRYIQGISIDTNEVPIAKADILHRILSIPGDQECFGLQNIQFELDSTTELIASDEQGRFALPMDWPEISDDGNYCLIVSASKPGFMTTTVSLPIALESLPSLVELELSRNRTIQGTVIGPNNSPVRSSIVLAWQPKDSSGSTVDVCQGANRQSDIDSRTKVEASTDEKGQFAFDIAFENDYCLQAFHIDWARSSAYLVQHNSLEGTIRLQLHNPHRITGTVTDLENQTVSGLTLQATGTSSTSPVQPRIATSDASGEFVFRNLDSDTYQLTAPEGRYHIAEPKTVSIDNGQPQRPLNITVFPITRFHGRVLDGYGEPLAGVEISTRSPFTAEQSTAITRSDSSGYFELASLHRSGTAHENFKMATDFVPSETGREFSGDVCVDVYHPLHGQQSLSLSATEASVDLGEIHLQQPALQIEGRILNHRNEPVSAKLIFTNLSAQDSKSLEVRMPRCDDLLPSREVISDQTGHFYLNLDSGGRYSVEVRTDRYQTRKLDLDIPGSMKVLDIKLD